MSRERRRRGHRRQRRGEAGPPPQPQRPRQEPPEPREESQAPGVLPPRLAFWRRRAQRQGKRKPEQRRVTPTAQAVSPLAFWRRSQPRSYRERPLPKRTPGRLWRRLTGFDFPPWAPVLLIMIVVGGGIPAAIILSRQAGAVSPNSTDHWHARYEVFVCGQRQPSVPFFPGGVHTHAQGTIHIHPSLPSEEGSGARLVKWFEYGGGKLSGDTLRLPGDKEYKNDDPCESGEFAGEPAVVQVFVNGERREGFDRYIPQDGDVIRIVFAPEGELPPGTVGATPTPVEATATPTASPTPAPSP